MNTGSLSSGKNVQRNWSSHSRPLVRVKTVNDGGPRTCEQLHADHGVISYAGHGWSVRRRWGLNSYDGLLYYPQLTATMLWQAVGEELIWHVWTAVRNGILTQYINKTYGDGRNMTQPKAMNGIMILVRERQQKRSSRRREINGQRQIRE